MHYSSYLISDFFLNFRADQVPQNIPRYILFLKPAKYFLFQKVLASHEDTVRVSNKRFFQNSDSYSTHSMMD